MHSVAEMTMDIFSSQVKVGLVSSLVNRSLSVCLKLVQHFISPSVHKARHSTKSRRAKVRIAYVTNDTIAEELDR